MNIDIKEIDDTYVFIIDHENGIKTSYDISYRELFQLYNKMNIIINKKENIE